MNIGVTGLIIVVGLISFLWWVTKGRRRSEDIKIRQAEESARIGKIIENNTAVINNNTKVIEANTLQRADEKRCLEALADRMAEHGKQLDRIETQQAICLDRQR